MAAVSALDLRDVSAELGGRRVLDDVTLSVEPGQRVAICGPNGAGKTSLLKAALGLLRSSGQVRLGGDPLDRLSHAEGAARAAYLPQDRRVAWNMRALEIAALGAPLASRPEGLARAAMALARLGVADLAERGVAELSGGERARVLMARFLVARAPLMLADEPAAGLDPDAQLLALEVLDEEARAGAAVVATLHDLTLAARWADRVVVIDGGRIVGDAAPATALSAQTLASAFGLDAHWIDTPDGPLLSARRRA